MKMLSKIQLFSLENAKYRSRDCHISRISKNNVAEIGASFSDFEEHLVAAIKIQVSQISSEFKKEFRLLGRHTLEIKNFERKGASKKGNGKNNTGFRKITWDLD